MSSSQSPFAPIVAPMWRAAFLLFLSACDPAFDGQPRDAGVFVPRRGPDCLVMPDIDFGEVLTQGVQQFKLNNGATTPRTIVVGEVSRPFKLSLAGPAVIGPGESLTLIATFIATDSLVHFASFEFVGGVGCAPQTVDLRALGAGTVIAPRQLDFGPVPLSAPATRPLVLVNTRRAPVDLSLRVNAAGDGPAFTLSPARVSLAAQSTVSVDVTLTPPHPGLINAVLLIEGSVDPLFTELRAIGGVPQVELPQVVDLDLPSFAGSTDPVWARRSLSPTNTGDGPLTFVAPPFFTVTSSEGATELSLVGLVGAVVEPGATLPLLVEVRTESPSTERSWVVTLRTVAPQPMRFEVRGHRVEFPACEQLVVEPTSVALGGLPRGASTTAEVTLRNTGQTECVIDDLHIESTASWRTSSPPRVRIPSGATATIPLSVSLPNQPFALQAGALVFRVLSPGRDYDSVPLSARAN